MGSALRQAVCDLRARVQRVAAGLDNNGAPQNGSGPGEVPRYLQILKRSGLPSLEGHGQWSGIGGLEALDANGQGNASTHWHQGGVAVEIDVDLQTGRIQVLRAFGASYAARIVSATRVRQQNEGGMIFGLGPALFEELSYEDGQPVNVNLSDYTIASIADIPTVGSVAVEDPDGIGELHGSAR